jgi:hypothetical protein
MKSACCIFVAVRADGWKIAASHATRIDKK